VHYQGFQNIGSIQTIKIISSYYIKCIKKKKVGKNNKLTDMEMTDVSKVLMRLSVIYKFYCCIHINVYLVLFGVM